MNETANQYDDSATGGYSYEEKLAMVQAGTMDPKEIGLSDASEAQAEEEPKEMKLGDYITFECSEVPIGLRAHWARQEQKIQPANPRKFEADWIEEHTNEHLLQARIRCGSAVANLQRLVTDQLPGMIILMREAADLLEKKAEELKNV